jgi:hypothetical protein
MAENKEKVAIKIGGGKNIRIEDNVSVGFDKLAEIGKVEGLSAKRNVALTAGAKEQRDPWYKKPIGLVGVGLFIAIVAALFVARLNQWF